MTWLLDQSDATQLRAVVAVYADPSGDLADVCVPAPGELLTSHTGSALANAAGSFVRIGQGGFYYQGALADAVVEGFTAIVLVKSGFRTMIAFAPVLGSSGDIWIPLTIYNDGDLATGCNPSGMGELQMSTNGVTWTAATGTFHEIGHGAYYYAHDVTNLEGFLAIKVAKIGFDEAIAWGSVDSAGSVIIPPSPPAPVGIGSSGNGVMAGMGFWSVS